MVLGTPPQPTANRLILMENIGTYSGSTNKNAISEQGYSSPKVQLE